MRMPVARILVVLLFLYLVLPNVSALGVGSKTSPEGALSPLDRLVLKNQVVTFHGHSIGLRAAALSRDGERLASGDMRGEIRVWDLTKRVPQQVGVMKRRPLPEEEPPPEDKEPPDRAAPQLPRPVVEMNGHELPVFALAFSPDRRLLAALYALGKRPRLWDLSKPKWREIEMPLRHEDDVNSVAFSPDGGRIATAGANDATARLWEVARAGIREGPVLKHRGYFVSRVAFSPDSNKLVTGIIDNERIGNEFEGDRVALWDLGTRSITKNAFFRSGLIGVDRVGFGPEGATVAAIGRTPGEGQRSSYSNLTVKVWDTRTRKLIQQNVLEGDKHYGIADMVFSPDLKTVAAAGGGGQVFWWELASGKRVGEWKLSTKVHAICFSADGRHVVTGNENGTISIIRLKSQD